MDASASYYAGFILWTYDFFVLFVSNYFIWRCPTRSVLVPFWKRHIGENAHLDVGVGTGYYPAAAASHLAKTKNVTLFDLNPNTLATAERRLRHSGYPRLVDKVQQSIFHPLPESLRAKFDSISLCYVLHCLPGAFPEKASRVFANLATALAPGGVVYGATILGRNVHHNWPGRCLMWIYNDKGIFGNRDDSVDDLEKVLKSQFEDVEVQVVGVVALFTARKPFAKLGKAMSSAAIA
ncbi:hypothetical protein AcV7_007100 [Taiwanofungus camphoratus]|nr:hypothetical protein AcV7_007100 [Antrodia cinnamomea]